MICKRICMYVDHRNYSEWDWNLPNCFKLLGFSHHTHVCSSWGNTEFSRLLVFPFPFVYVCTVVIYVLFGYSVVIVVDFKSKSGRNSLKHNDFFPIAKDGPITCLLLWKDSLKRHKHDQGLFIGLFIGTDISFSGTIPRQ